MKPYPELTPLSDRWLRLTGMGLLIGFVSLDHFFFNTKPVKGTDWAMWGIDVLAILSFWEVARFLIIRLRTRLTGWRRFAILCAAGVAATASLNVLFYVLRFRVQHGAFSGLFDSFNTTISIMVNDRQSRSSYLATNLLNSTFKFLLFYGLYEVFFLVRETRQSKARLQRAEQEKAAFEKAALQSQLEALKQQVNPHFLFNSLNSLGALIEEDPAQASRFLDELSNVYRYLLRSNEHALTPLASELAFIRSYFHLLQTRHGQSLRLELAVAEQYETYRLPPLTLQLLVENAVKHNVSLPEQPLTIRISTEEGRYLRVLNTLQRKKKGVLSNGVGLSNIQNRYRMLGQPAPVVSETDGQFVVQVPLIEP